VGSVLTRVGELDLDLRNAPARPRYTRVLMADPRYFAVEYVINPHMAAHVGQVDGERARVQWEAVRDAYRSLGYEVPVLPAAPGLPDQVFVANPSLPFVRADGGWGVVLSRMAHPERRGEVPLIERWMAEQGAEVLRLEGVSDPFEGMGDALWVPDRRVLIGGHGIRTGLAAYEVLARLLDVPVLAVRLVDERFYHLDTCLSLLDESTALCVPEAFDDEGRALLAAAFPRLVELPLEESAELLACNGHCPDRRHFLVQSGSARTAALVRGLGFEVLELDTSEFLKSGGSVFCMKLMLP